jgi:hypothetical protein
MKNNIVDYLTKEIKSSKNNLNDTFNIGGTFVSKTSGIISGVEIFIQILEKINRENKIYHIKDSKDLVNRGDSIVSIRSNSNDIIRIKTLGENLLSSLSSVSTTMSKYLQEIKDLECDVYVFQNITSNIETQLSSKASESDLSSTNLKVENLENNLENLSHGFQHINSQTQFAVRTSLPGKGSKVIQVYNLIGPASNEWDLVAITTVIANNDTIYPEITYSGNIDEGKNDNRTVSITFEHAGTENLPVTLIVSALKAIEEHIIEID